MATPDHVVQNTVKLLNELYTDTALEAISQWAMLHGQDDDAVAGWSQLSQAADEVAFNLADAHE